MIKHNTKHESSTVSYESSLHPKPARRLIVPILNPDADPSAVAHRVWELANGMGVSIKFIGLCNDAHQELSLRRMLTILSAMVNDENVCAEFEIIRSGNLVSALRSHLQSRDTVVCWPDYQTGVLRTT